MPLALRPGTAPMSAAWQLRVYEHQRLVHTTEGFGPVELGRQMPGEAGPFSEARDSLGRRLVIARLDEAPVSRKHVRIAPLPDGRVRLANLSLKLPLQVNSSSVAPETATEVSLPVMLTVGRRTVRVQAPDSAAVPLLSLTEATVPPLVGGPSLRFPGSKPAPAPAPGMDPEHLCRWLQAAMGVLQGVAGSREFFPRAARAVVDLVGLDSGRVLLLDRGEWKVQAAEHAPGPPAPADWRPSRQVLQRLVSEKRTYWIAPQTGADGAQSLVGVDAVVAAPILNAA